MKTAIKEKTSKYRDSNRAYYLAHKEDIIAKSKQYYKNNKESIKKYRQEKNIKEEVYRVKNLSKFGISIEEYQDIYDKQNGSCAICNNVCVTGRRLAVDHDHTTNKVRGLLCGKCNMAIGLMRDDIYLLKKSIIYLQGEL